MSKAACRTFPHLITPQCPITKNTGIVVTVGDHLVLCHASPLLLLSPDPAQLATSHPLKRGP